jgi:hypothetical protein
MKQVKNLILTGSSVCILCIGAGHAGTAQAAGGPSEDEVTSEVQKSLSEMVPYVSTRGFKLKYPKTWEVTDFKEGLLACKFKTLNGLVSTRIAIEELPAGIALEAYSSSTFSAVKKYMDTEKMPITLVSEGSTDFGSSPARKSVFTYTIPGTPVTTTTMQIVSVKNGRGYAFNYTAESILFDRFLPVVTKMVKSMEWP